MNWSFTEPQTQTQFNQLPCSKKNKFCQLLLLINIISVQKTSENLFCLGTYFGMPTCLAPTISITSLLLHSVSVPLSGSSFLPRVQGSLLSLIGGAISSAFYHLSYNHAPPSHVRFPDFSKNMFNTKRTET